MPTEALCHHCGHVVLSGARFCQHCGSDVSQEQGLAPTQQWATPRPTLQPTALDLLRQDTLGEFEILAELGRGGMATVYLAHDIPLDRKVAIKVMSAALMDEGLAERFRREARTAAALNHPHIIPVYAVRERSGLLYFVMKYIAGQSLDPIVKSGAPISIPMAHAVLAQAAAALGYAHRRGVIHRDVKPANIMLDDEGWVVMTDFGIAKVATATGLTMTGVTVGTPAYMSPEQCAGKEVTGASDQYSLGVLAYELITGRKPFTATTAMAMMYSHFNDTPEPLRTHRPDCPPELEEKVLRMLAKSPEDRWPSIEEIFGPPALAHDDPTRQALVALALSNPNVAIGRLSTPTSPIPPARRSASTTFPLQQLGALPPADAGRPMRAPGSQRRRWTGVAIGTIAIAGLATAGYLAFGPAPASPVTTDSAPAPAAAFSPESAAGKADSQGATAQQPDTQPSAPPPAATEVPAPVTLASVRASTASVDLEVGKTARVAAQVFGSDGKMIRQPPALSWRSTAPKVVSVSRDGTLRGLASGTASVIAAASGKADTIEVRVSAPIVAPAPAPLAAAQPETTIVAPPLVAAVVLSGPTAPLKVGEMVQLSAVARSAKGEVLSDRRITWESSDQGVASVANGVVTAKVAGNTTITASVEGRSATYRIVVAVPVDPVAERARAATEIAAILNRFAGALNGRSMTQLKAAYPTVRPDEEERWNAMLTSKGLNRVEAEFRPVEPPQIEQTSARQRVSLRLELAYAGRPTSSSTTRYLASFEQLGGKWQLVRLDAE